MICQTCNGYGVTLGAAPDKGNPECADCRGSGVKATVKSEPAKSPCPLCRGSGKLYRSAHSGGKPAKNTAGETLKPPVLEETNCPRCAGSGNYVPVKPDGTPILTQILEMAERLGPKPDAPLIVGPAEVPKPGRAVEVPKLGGVGLEGTWHLKATRYEVLDKRTRKVLRSAPFKGYKIKADGSGHYEPVEEPAHNPETEIVAIVYA